MVDETYTEKRVNPDWLMKAREVLKGKIVTKRWKSLGVLTVASILPPAVALMSVMLATGLLLYDKIDEPFMVETEVKVVEEEPEEG